MHEVLLVDDDADCRKTLSAIIGTRHKWRTTEAADGVQAARLFRANPDVLVIVSDYDMGGGEKNGDTLFASVRQELDRRGGVFILTSAVISDEKRLFFERNGVQVVEKFRLFKEFGALLEAIGLTPGAGAPPPGPSS